MRLRNFTTSPVRGWFRTTTDVELGPKVRAYGHDIVRGRKIGVDCWAIDVWAQIGAGETLEIPLDDADPYDDWTPGAVPNDIVGHFGGVPALNGKALDLVSIQPDGAGFRGHYRVRIGRMFNVDLFLGPWYPDHPAIVPAEVMLTCSNPEVPDMGDTLPELRLTFGDGYLYGTLPKPGMRCADGQARIIPVCFVWPRHLRTPEDWGPTRAPSPPRASERSAYPSCCRTGTRCCRQTSTCPDGLRSTGFGACRSCRRGSTHRLARRLTRGKPEPSRTSVSSVASACSPVASAPSW